MKTAVALALLLGASPAWAAPPPSSHPSTADLAGFGQLKEAFDGDAGHVRLVALLSPSCGYCVKGYRYMQRILDEVPDERLRMYVVWEPMLSGDNRALAERMSRKAGDPRLARHFWDPQQLSGKAWQRTLELPGVAWDVYFVYGPDARWDENAPTTPDYWQHQGAGSPDTWLDYQTLKGAIVSRLAEIPR